LYGLHNLHVWLSNRNETDPPDTAFIGSFFHSVVYIGRVRRISLIHKLARHVRIYVVVGGWSGVADDYTAYYLKLTEVEVYVEEGK